MENEVPIDVAVIKAENEIVSAINSIVQKYQLPNVVTQLLIGKITAQSQNINLSSLLSTYNVTENTIEMSGKEFMDGVANSDDSD